MSKQTTLYVASVTVSSLLLAILSGVAVTANYATAFAQETGKKYSTGYVELAKGRISATQQLAAGKKKLDSGKATLDGYRQQLDDGNATLTSSQIALNDGKAQLDEGAVQLADYWAQLRAGRTQLDTARAQIQKGKKDLTAARQQLIDGEKSVAAGQISYDDGVRHLAEGQAVQASLTTLANAIPNLLATVANPTTTLAQNGLSKDLLAYYNGAQSWQDFIDLSQAFVAAGNGQISPAIQTSYSHIIESQLAAQKENIDNTTTEQVAAKVAQDFADAATIEIQGSLIDRATYAAMITPGVKEAVTDAFTQQITATVQQQLKQLGQQVLAGIETIGTTALNQTGQLQQLTSQGKQLVPTADFSSLQAALTLPQSDISQKMAKTISIATILGSPQFTSTLAKARQIIGQQLADGQKVIAAGKAQLDAGKKALEEGRSAYSTGAAALNSGQAEYAKGESDYATQYAQVATGQEEWNKNNQAYQEGLAQFESGRTTYLDQEAQYEKGVSDWEAGKKQYTEGKAKANQQLADGEKQLKTAKDALTLLGTKISTQKASSTSPSTEPPTLNYGIETWQAVSLIIIGIVALITSIWTLLSRSKVVGASRLGEIFGRITLQHTAYAGVASAVGILGAMVSIPPLIRSFAGDAIESSPNLILIFATFLLAVGFSVAGTLISRRLAEGKATDL